MLCEFCGQDEGDVEFEIFNISSGDVITCIVCEACVVAALGTPVSYDSEGIPYSTLGYIGGSPEEIN